MMRGRRGPAHSLIIGHSGSGLLKNDHAYTIIRTKGIDAKCLPIQSQDAPAASSRPMCIYATNPELGCHAHGSAWACSARDHPCPRKAVGMAPERERILGELN